MIISFMTTITRQPILILFILHLSSAFQSKEFSSGFTHRDITLESLEFVARQWLEHNARGKSLQNSEDRPDVHDDDLPDKERRMLILLKSYFGDNHNIAWLQFTNASKEICDANHDTDFRKDTKPNPDFHFDAERFLQSNLQISLLRNQTLKELRAGQFSKARQHFGVALHIVQDFFSHSNWVELYQSKTAKHIGTFRFASSLKFANSSVPSCNKVEPCQLFGFSGFKESLHPDLLSFNILTSGYFPKQRDRTGPIRRPSNKCSHGGFLDYSNICGGINKDDKLSPRGDLHEVAVKAARETTIEFMQELRAELSNERLFGNLLGLVVSPAVIFIVNLQSHADIFQKQAVQTLKRTIDMPLPPEAFILITHRTLDCVSVQTFVNSVDMHCELEHIGSVASMPQCDKQRELSLFANLAPNGSFIFVYAEEREERVMIERLIAMNHLIWHVFCSGLATNDACGHRNAMPSLGRLLKTSRASSDTSTDNRLLTESETGVEVFIAMREIYFDYRTHSSHSVSFNHDNSVNSYTIWLECPTLSFCPNVSISDPRGRPIRLSILSSASPCKQVYLLINSYTPVNPSDIGQWSATITADSSIVSTTCSFEIRARSYSSLLVSSSIEFPDGTNDSGSTRPIVSGLLSVELSVSHPSLQVNSVSMINIFGHQLNSFPLNITRPLFYTFKLHVPTIPVRLQFECMDVSNKHHFVRIHEQLFEPTYIGLVLNEFDGMTFSIDKNGSIPSIFQLNATNFGPEDQLNASIIIHENFRATLPVSTLRAKQNETVQFTIFIFAFAGADYGTRADIPVAVTGFTAGSSQILIIPVEVRPLINDFFPPAIELINNSYSSCTENSKIINHTHTGCNSSFWTVYFTFSDVGSGPHAIELSMETESQEFSVSFKKADKFPRRESNNATLVEFSTDWVSDTGSAEVHYSARLAVSCCVQNLELSVRDRMDYSDKRTVVVRRFKPRHAAVRDCRPLSSPTASTQPDQVFVTAIIGGGILLVIMLVFVICTVVICKISRKNQSHY